MEELSIDTKYRHLRALLASEEWNTLMLPYLQAFRESDMIRLSMMRKEDNSLTDDFLRGRIDAFNFFLRGLPAQADEWEKTLFPPKAEPEDESQPFGVGSPYAEGPTPEDFQRG